MKTNLQKLLLLTVGVLLFSQTSHAERDWVCRNPDKKPGGWGTYTGSCDADQFGDIERVKVIYPKFIFDRRLDYPGQTAEYITRMHSLIKQVAKKYLVKRNADATEAEIEAFQLAAVAIASQESMMTHYRFAADDRLKLMTGDQLNSHGMMQVNQVFHANRGGMDTSLDLVGNIQAGLDVYYTDGWRRAPDRKCWDGLNSGASAGKRLSIRTRMSYSAYNGGPDAICRISTPNHPHSLKDRAFNTKLTEKPWARLVTDENAPTGLAIDALMAGDDYGAVARDKKGEFLTSRTVVLENGKTCVTLDGSNFQCADDMRVFSCLARLHPEALENDPVRMDKLPEGAKMTTVTNREQLCMRAVKNLFAVGQKITLKKEITLRSKVGGTPIVVAKVGPVFQVLDYELRLSGKTERYYKVKTSRGIEGWVFGGDDSNWSEWIQAATSGDEAAAQAARPAATPSRTDVLNSTVVAGETLNDQLDDNETSTVIPVVGSIIEVVSEEALSLRPEPGNDKVEAVAYAFKGVRLEVEEVLTKSNATSENLIYLKVSVGDKTGYIYGGRTFPTVTVDKWIKIVK